MAEKLTPAQQAAVTDRGGPLLVSAAAGSGKTKVLVDRLMSYLLDPQDPANIDEFLIITYTKAAASELRGKIAAKLTEHLSLQPENRHLRKQLQRLYLAKISTVHSFCSDLLREYAFRLELPGEVRIAEEQEAQEIQQDVLDQVLEDAYSNIDNDLAFQAFADTQGAGRTDRDIPLILLSVYGSAQCHPDPERWLQQCLDQGRIDGITDASQTVWGSFLIEQFHSRLDDQICTMKQLLVRIQDVEDICTKYSPILYEDVENLETLRRCNTWESIRANLIHSFSRMPTVRTPSDPDLKSAVCAVRDAMKKSVIGLQAPFTIESERLLSDMEDAQLSNEGLCRQVLEFSKRYRTEKDRRRVLDFGDLEHMALHLLLGKSLSAPTRAAQEIGGRFREVMVDEYQDTNEVQDRIFSALTAERGNLFMVGDVKQSIYRFRLADPGIFLEKYKTFLPQDQAQPGQGRKILLSDNFRSGGEILSAANEVFHASMCPQVGGLYYGTAEALREGIPHEPLPQPAVEFHCIQLVDGDEKSQAEPRFVAARIKEMLDTPAMIRSGDGLRPVTPGDIVILLRSPGSQGQYYLDALEGFGIPAHADSGGNILQTSEISILRSLLEVLDNPLRDISLQSVLLSPLFGFTADHLGSLRAGNKNVPLYSSLEHAAENQDQQAQDFLTLLNELRETARRETVSRLLDEIFERTHIESIFSAMDSGSVRQRNLRLFYEAVSGYQAKDLSQLLDHLNQMDEKGLKPEEKSSSGQAVSILSIHKSKGLEYPVVFLANLSGKFNQDDLRRNVLSDPQLGIGGSAYNALSRSRYPTLAKMAIHEKLRLENISEELRILYVAMTRAKDMLVMTYADKAILKHLTDLVTRLTPENSHSISQEASCLGHWVLISAMLHTEAGALFQEVGYPVASTPGQFPWRITFSTSSETADSVAVPDQHATSAELTVSAESAAPDKSAEPEKTLLPDETELRHVMTFSYAHSPAVSAPSKITATQLKGRNLDNEAADGAFQPIKGPRRRFRDPSFAAPAPMTSREIGIATHLAMQYIRYESCTDEAGVEEELTRLLREEFINQRQYEAVNRLWITSFFQTGLGWKLRQNSNILREFKFSIMVDGTLLDADLAGEQLLLQGVVDCCILEDDGLTVVDFKTDHVEPGKEAQAGIGYIPQVQTYGRALSKIWGLPVKKLLLYFFCTSTYLEVAPE